MHDLLKKYPGFLVISCILFIALLLRLPLFSGSFWLDEAAQALESARPLTQQLDIRDDFQPPLLHLITYVSIRLSTAEWWLRLWGALIPGLISIYYTYKIGTRVRNQFTGILAAGLLTTSSLHIFFSQELRPYALPTALATASTYFLLRWLDSQRQQYWFWYTGLSILGLYSSYLYPFLLIGQAVWILIYPKQWKQYAVSLFVIGVGFVPWLPKFLEQLAAGTTVRTELPGWEAVVSVTQLKAIPLVLAKFLFGVLPVDVSAPYILLTATVGTLFVVLFWFNRARITNKTYFVASWLCVPLLAAWIISFWVPVIQPKRVLFLLPAFYLLVADQVLLVRQKKSVQAHAAILLTALLLSLNLYSTYRYYTDHTLQRENWRALHQQITTQYPADQSVVVFSFPGPFAPWDWYDSGTYPTWSTGKLTTNAVADLPNSLKTVTDKEYILVFDYLRDLTDPQDQIPATLESFGYRERQVIDYPNIGFVRVFTRQETILSLQSL